MSSIDHLSLGVPDVARAQAFYDDLLAALDIQCLASNGAFAAYGRGRVSFLVMRPSDGAAAQAGNGTHICFSAPTPAHVDRFHAVALARGGRCEGAPGPRPDYPKPGVYAAFVRDPFGHKLEAIHNGFAS